MSEWVGDTPDLSRAYCPTCEPEADVTREILTVRWCMEHYPVVTGTADAAARTTGVTLSGSEFDAAVNRAVCALLAGRGGLGATAARSPGAACSPRTPAVDPCRPTG
jgi:hypothetical protein